MKAGLGELSDAFAEALGSIGGFRARPAKSSAPMAGSGRRVLADEPPSGRPTVVRIPQQGSVG